VRLENEGANANEVLEENPALKLTTQSLGKSKVKSKNQSEGTIESDEEHHYEFPHSNEQRYKEKKQLCGRGFRIFILFLILVHWFMFIIYLVVDIFALFDDDQDTRPWTVIIGNIFWIPLNLINSLLMAMYFVYVFTKGHSCDDTGCGAYQECRQISSNIQTSFQSLFPGLFFYLIFIDALGFSIAIYNKDKTHAHGIFFIRGLQVYVDIFLILLDCFLAIVYFTVTNYGISSDKWTELCNNFITTNRDLNNLQELKDFLGNRPLYYVDIKNTTLKKLLMDALSEARCNPTIKLKEDLKHRDDYFLLIRDYSLRQCDEFFGIGSMTSVAIEDLKNPSKIGCLVVSEVMFDSSDIFKDLPRNTKQWLLTYDPPNLCCYPTQNKFVF